MQEAYKLWNKSNPKNDHSQRESVTTKNRKEVHKFMLSRSSCEKWILYGLTKLESCCFHTEVVRKYFFTTPRVLSVLPRRCEKLGFRLSSGRSRKSNLIVCKKAKKFNNQAFVKLSKLRLAPHAIFRKVSLIHLCIAVPPAQDPQREHLMIPKTRPGQATHYCCVNIEPNGILSQDFLDPVSLRDDSHRDHRRLLLDFGRQQFITLWISVTEKAKWKYIAKLCAKRQLKISLSTRAEMHRMNLAQKNPHIFLWTKRQLLSSPGALPLKFRDRSYVPITVKHINYHFIWAPSPFGPHSAKGTFPFTINSFVPKNSSNPNPLSDLRLTLDPRLLLFPNRATNASCKSNTKPVLPAAEPFWAFSFITLPDVSIISRSSGGCYDRIGKTFCSWHSIGVWGSLSGQHPLYSSPNPDYDISVCADGIGFQFWLRKMESGFFAVLWKWKAPCMWLLHDFLPTGKKHKDFTFKILFFCTKNLKLGIRLEPGSCVFREMIWLKGKTNGLGHSQVTWDPRFRKVNQEKTRNAW